MWLIVLRLKGNFGQFQYSVLFETASCFSFHIFTIACFLFVIIKKGEIVGLRELRTSVLLTSLFRLYDNKHFQPNIYIEGEFQVKAT